MLIILTSATQLLVLSILGEYLGRAYLETKRRPLFIVDQIVRKSIELGRPSQRMTAQNHSTIDTGKGSLPQLARAPPCQRWHLGHRFSRGAATIIVLRGA